MARWPDPKYNNETTPKQKEYGKSFWKATRKAGSEIADGTITSLDELWAHATEWRGKVAGSAQRTFTEHRRGPHDSTVPITDLTEKYGYIRERYAHRQDGSLEGLPFGLPEQRRFQIHDEIGDAPVSLTSVIMSADPTLDISKAPYTNLRANGLRQLGYPYHIAHTASADVPRIMAHAESLFRRTLDPQRHNNEALMTMGELHWWLTQAMPDPRGSAAKAEFCVRSIAQARGMDLPPFQHGIVPDLEAMTTPRTEFVDKYPRLFEGA